MNMQQQTVQLHKLFAQSLCSLACHQSLHNLWGLICVQDKSIFRTYWLKKTYTYHIYACVVIIIKRICTHLQYVVVSLVHTCWCCVTQTCHWQWSAVHHCCQTMCHTHSDSHLQKSKTQTSGNRRQWTDMHVSALRVVTYECVNISVTSYWIE